MTHKEAIAAFYRELYEGKKGTKEYERQAMARLKTILQKFRMKNKSFPGPVQDPWEFFSYYAELNWFPRHKKMLEELSDNMLIGKVDMEFKAFLRAEQYKLRPVVDPKEMPEPKPKPQPQTETEPFGVDIPPQPGQDGLPHKAHRDKDGNWTVDGQRADHQLTKTILDFREPTEEEKDSDRREMEEKLQLLQQLLQRLNSGWMKDDPVCQAMRQHFITRIDHEHDAEQNLEDEWRARDAFKVIEKALKEK